ncbi:MAG: hypothetical protein QOJ59_655 [Thermomicrobiales bacterium]|jgi:hypothetical protein|nr:hypothetical protein [Thermomicrobiales bacterium]
MTGRGQRANDETPPRWTHRYARGAAGGGRIFHPRRPSGVPPTGETWLLRTKDGRASTGVLRAAIDGDRRSRRPSRLAERPHPG